MKPKIKVAILGLMATVALPVLQSSQTGAAVVGEPDRLTVAQWAQTRELDLFHTEQRYAATGVVTCHWNDPERGPRTSIASGQVTGLRGLVTLSAHTFIELNECVPKAQARNCQFSITTNGGTQIADLTEVVAIGIDCDSSQQMGLGDRLINDWAVATLDRSLDVVPYRISDLSETIEENRPVVAVVHSQDYLVVDAAGDTFHPKTIGTCIVRDTLSRFGTLAYFTTDCDGAQRSSGGSVLDDSFEIPMLIGVWAAASEGRRLLDQAVERVLEAGEYRDDLANVADYDVNLWSSRHVAVAGDFLAAIRQAIRTINAGEEDRS